METFYETTVVLITLVLVIYVIKLIIELVKMNLDFKSIFNQTNNTDKEYQQDDKEEIDRKEYEMTHQYETSLNNRLTQLKKKNQLPNQKKE